MTDTIERPRIQQDDQLFPQAKDKKQSKRLEKLGKIRGKTLDVYYYLVDNPGKHGVREIQRALDYNSASVSSYHLNRLYEYNLISKTEQGKYFIEGDPVKLGALEDHIRVAGYLVPRIAIYGLQAVFAILLGLLLFVIEAEPIIWFLYVVIVNGIVIIKVAIDSKQISDKLNVNRKE